MRALSVAYGVTLGVLLAPTPPVHAEKWVSARSDHFAIVSNGGEKTARRVAVEFERFRTLFKTVLNVRVDPGIPIIVLAVDDEDGMRELLPWFWERKGGARPAGVFFNRPDKIYVVLRTDVSGVRQHSVIFHEYVHLLTSLNFRWLPLWLNEGLAEFYATADIRNEEVRFGQIEPNHIRLLRHVTPLSVQELLAVDRFSPHYQEQTRTTIFYAQSAALTHFLILGDKRKGDRSLGRFIQLLGEGTDNISAATEAFGDLDDLDRDLRSYIRQLRFLGAKLDTRLDAGTIRAETLPPAQAAVVRGDFLALVGRLAEAAPLVEEALRLDPQLSLAHEARGQLLWRRGEREEAAGCFAKAARLDPSSFLAPYYEARTTDRGLEDAADRIERGYRRSIALNPSFAPAHTALAAHHLSRHGDLDEAFQLALRAVQLRPDVSAYWLTLLRVLDGLEQAPQVREIEAQLRRAARYDPDTLMGVSSYLEEDDRAEEAESLLRDALARNPGATRVVMRLGSLLEGQQRPDDAEAVLRAGLAVQPDSALLLNALAYLNADRKVKVPEALDLVEKALKKQPRDPDYLDTRGWALHRLGRNAEAEKALREAAAIRESPVVLDHLGDVCHAQGAVDEAVALWNRARGRSDASDELRERVSGKIEEAEGKGGEAAATAASG